MIFPQAIECGLDGICPSPGAQWSAGAGEFLSQLAEVRNLLTFYASLWFGLCNQTPSRQSGADPKTPFHINTTLFESDPGVENAFPSVLNRFELP